MAQLALRVQDLLAAVAEDLRAAVKDDGRVSVAFCHPAYAWRQPTPEAVPGPVPYAHPERSFLWSKTVRSTGARRIESHRPERTLVRLLARAGLAVMSRRESETVDLERFEPSADLLVLELAPLAPLPDVTLLVKACAMEAETLETQVQHIVRQTERPRAFAERLLVLDSRTGGFLRQHTDGDAGALRAAADRLMDDGWIDRVIEGPTDGFRAAEVNERWFGEGAPSGHAVTGAQVSSTLAGFDACTTRWVLQADADVMVCREDPAHDYLADMVAAATGVETGVTVSFNIASEGDRVYTTEGPDGPWRTEVRLCLLDLDRLRVMRPLPNRRRGDALEVPWHRSLGRSLRGGDRRTFYIHPPNERKRDRQLWWSALDAVERGRTPAVQQGQVDWVGSPQDWTPPERFERFVFVVAGRGVPAGRFRRALDSILRQRFSDWGAIVIDDASSPALVDEMRACCRPHAERVSFIGNRDRRGLLANMVTAIRGLCGDPESVIVTLDADDELLGDQVLDRLAEEYGRGADMTVGSMLRTDKAVHYPVRFEAPRLHRGGNVWQHLRSFKKRLFDAIPDHALRLDSEYVDLANDWAYMLPLVELAESPSYIPEPLYLHEPSGDGKAADRPAREAVIARIVGKPSLSRARRAS